MMPGRNSYSASKLIHYVPAPTLAWRERMHLEWSLLSLIRSIDCAGRRTQRSGCSIAKVAELADAPDLGSGGGKQGGSSSPVCTQLCCCRDRIFSLGISGCRVT